MLPRRITTLALAFLALVAVACAAPAEDGADPGALPGPEEDGRVLEVGDGDSLLVVVDGRRERVRLIGINAPELEECFGVEARRALADLAGGAPVVLTADSEDRDRYDRLLRYVHVGDTFINLALVEGGYALARPYPPNTAHQEALEAAEARARAAQRGMWAPEACRSAAAELVVSEIRADPSGRDEENPNGEWVAVLNPGEIPRDLSGWSLRDESARHRYRFPAGLVLDAGATVVVHSGCGLDQPLRLHWCAGTPVWDNDGDTAYLLDPSGRIAGWMSY